MNRFIPFGISTVLLCLVYLTTCRGDPDTTTQAVNSIGTSESPNVQVGNCTTFTSNGTCCSNTDCSWVVCLTTSVNHTGCHNLSDTNDKKTAADQCKVNATKIEEDVTCSYQPSNITTSTPVSTSTTTQAPTIPPAPIPGTCEAFTNQTACCGPNGLKLECLYVNCTTKQDPKETTLCLNSTNIASKCQTASVKVICNSNTSSTTPAPTTPKPTTPSPITPSLPNTTTNAPPATTLAPHTGTTEHGQHFDGASFIGGMILMAGLFIIGFFALKFYRARKDRSYRTL